LLEHPQQLHLHFWRRLADLSLLFPADEGDGDKKFAKTIAFVSKKVGDTVGLFGGPAPGAVWTKGLGVDGPLASDHADMRFTAAKLSALRLRPWEGATVALDRLVPFPARVTGWSLSQDGGVDLVMAEENSAVWDWNPATDERATGANPSVVLPNPGRIAVPASISGGRGDIAVLSRVRPTIAD
jgi:hypothetical protein